MAQLARHSGATSSAPCLPLAPVAGAVTILAFDPGIAHLGWGVVAVQGRRVHHVAHGALSTEPGDGPEFRDRGRRVARLEEAALDLFERFQPSAVAGEGYTVGRRAGQRTNPTAAAKVSAVVAMLEATARAHGLELALYREQSIKLGVTADRYADKARVQAIVSGLLGLPAMARPTHAADALAVAVHHARTVGLAAPPGSVAENSRLSVASEGVA